MTKKRSSLEVEFEYSLKALRFPAFETEHQFHPTRRWRFDFAWPELMIAAEVEGGTWTGGRHTRGLGFHNDCVKYGEAAILGWRVLRLDSKLVKSGEGIEMLERLIESKK